MPPTFLLSLPTFCLLSTFKAQTDLSLDYAYEKKCGNCHSGSGLFHLIINDPYLYTFFKNDLISSFWGWIKFC